LLCSEIFWLARGGGWGVWGLGFLVVDSFFFFCRRCCAQDLREKGWVSSWACDGRVIRGAFVLEFLGAGERAWGSWIFLALGNWSAWVRQQALGRLGSASIA
jgi:hypothetical protein